MPIRAETFVETYSAVVPTAAPSLLDLFTITIPAKAIFRGITFGNICGTLLAWGTVYWVFLLDGLPLYPYQTIMDQVGFATSRQNIQGIDITGGHTLVIRAYNPTAGDCRMGISLEYVLEYPEQ